VFVASYEVRGDRVLTAKRLHSKAQGREAHPGESRPFVSYAESVSQRRMASKSMNGTFRMDGPRRL
jgi:hypothetical protein